LDFIRENLMLVLLAVASGAWILFPLLRDKLSGIRQAGTLEATQLINHEDALVLDVREDSELSAGRIPNARHIPLGQLGNRIKELEKFKTRPIVVGCRTGHRSVAACRTLIKQGFDKVYNLKGGVIAWEQAGLPMEKK
jgi:rhodanese-related sulfurtransferase